MPEEDASHLDEHQVIDLLLDLPSEEERERAEEHAERCPDCDQLLRQRGVEMERLRCSPTYLWLIAARRAPRGLGRVFGSGRGTSEATVLRIAHPQRRKPAPEKRGFFFRSAAALPWRCLAGVACALALLLVLCLRGEVSKNSLQIQALGWLPSVGEFLSVRDSADDSADPMMQAAMQAYDERELKKAVRGLEKARCESVRLETLRRVYLANALAHQGAMKETAEALSCVDLEKLPDPWRSESAWTLFLALRATGRGDGADTLLKHCDLGHVKP